MVDCFDGKVIGWSLGTAPMQAVNTMDKRCQTLNAGERR